MITITKTELGWGDGTASVEVNMKEHRKMDSFPAASGAHYHKLGSVKRQIFILPPFWRREVPNQGAVGADFPAEAPRGTFLGSSSFWGPQAFPGSGCRPPHLCLHVPGAVSTVHVSPPPLCLVRTLVMGFRTLPDNPGCSQNP